MKKISWYLQESNQGHKDFQSCKIFDKNFAGFLSIIL